MHNHVSVFLMITGVLKKIVLDAAAPSFDDSSWRVLDLPHDWSIEDLPAGQAGLPNQTVDTIVGPFSRSSIGKAATGFTVGGTGWYRKKFITEIRRAE